METYSSILAWRILWMEEPGRLQSMGLQRVGHNWATSLQLSLHVSGSTSTVQPTANFVVLWYTCVLSPVWLFATPRTIAHQAFLSMGFSRQEYWSGLPFPSSGDLLNPGIKLVSPATPALAVGFFYHWATWETHIYIFNLHVSGSTQFKSVLLMGQLYYLRKHC